MNDIKNDSHIDDLKVWWLGKPPTKGGSKGGKGLSPKLQFYFHHAGFEVSLGSQGKILNCN